MVPDDSLLFYSDFTDNATSTDCDEELSSFVTGAWSSLVSSRAIEFVYKNPSSEKPTDRQLDEKEQLQTAIAFLFAFIQANFTGPNVGCEYEALEEAQCRGNVDARKLLIVDGEELNVVTKFPGFLFAATKLVENLLKLDENRPEVRWWHLRLICTHQKVMDELCHSLYLNFKKNVEWFAENIDQLGSRELQALLMIEISEGYLLFHRTQKCEEWLTRACQFLEIEMKVEGLLGVRTKYQQKALPQLCLRVECPSALKLPPPDITNGTTNLPRLLKLDDDVRLERIQFSSAEDNDVVTNPSIIQCLIMAKLKHVMKSQPKDRLSDEEVEPYVTTLLYQEHGPLPVRLATLLLNAAQESNTARTVERSLKQCEEILALIESTKFSIPERLSYFFASMQPPKWSVQKQLGDLMVSLGLIKSALDVYLQIKSWEDVIFCYNRLELRHKAAEIIEQELQKQPTVALYCLLGDARSDVSCYEKAWNFSGQTSSRAQRHWGNHYYARNDYETAIPHFQKSLEINSLQEVTLLRLGYAAITTEKWELATQSYLRYTHLEPHGFEAWNNLAKALIKLGDKVRAHKILNEALKCNYNNWKVWDNFLVVSVDTGNFEDAINAYVRLVELKEKHKDLEVLGIVVKAVENDIPDSQGRPSARLKKKLNRLLAQQCVQHASEPKLWEFAACIAESELSRAEKLQKAYRGYIQSSQPWLSTVEIRKRVLDLCQELCISSLNAFSGELTNMEKSAAVSQLSSARLSTQASIRAVENAGPMAVDNWDETENVLRELKLLLENVTNKLKQSL